MREKKTTFYHCYTPLHIGSGTTLDIIDLPIQREVHTDFPVMPSSAIKGVIRAEYGLKNTGFKPDNFPDTPKKCLDGIAKDKCDKFFNLFGCGEKEGDIIFTDAKILLFPVKSAKGVFAWITCPLVLERFTRDTEKEIPKLDIKDYEAIAGTNIGIDNKYLVLEELSFQISQNEHNVLKKIHGNLPKNLQNEIKPEQLAIVSNNMFRYFVKNHTEVNARVRIDQTNGTVKEGALWYEELVPAETIFYDLILSRTDGKLEEIANFINNKIFQFGGDETLGRGFTRILMEENHEDA